MDISLQRQMEFLHAQLADLSADVEVGGGTGSDARDRLLHLTRERIEMYKALLASLQRLQYLETHESSAEATAYRRGELLRVIHNMTEPI